MFLRKITFASFLVAMAIASSGAFAESGPGSSDFGGGDNSGDKSGTNSPPPSTLTATATQAVAAGRAGIDERKRSNNTYQHSLEGLKDAERNHTHSGAPDPVLMSRAVSEARQAFALDNQSQEMARTSLAGLQSEALQQDQFATGGIASQVDVQALEEIAGHPSVYAAQAEKAFAAYGFALGTDQTSLDTPTANFSIDAAGAQKEAMGVRHQAGDSTGSDMSGQFPMGTFPASGAKPVGLGATGDLQSTNSSSLRPADLSTGLVASSGIQGAPPVKKLSKAEAMKLLESNRNLILSQMGRKPAAVQGPESITEPLRKKSEDIFQVIHVHYEFLRKSQAFYELNLPANATPEEPDTLPAYSRGQ